MLTTPVVGSNRTAGIFCVVSSLGSSNTFPVFKSMACMGKAPVDSKRGEITSPHAPASAGPDPDGHWPSAETLTMATVVAAIGNQRLILLIN